MPPWPGWNGRVTAPPDDCLARNEWICGAYLSSRREILMDAALQHLQLTALAVLIGLALAVPLALAARRWRWAAGPVLGLTTILYTIPSLAMFSLLLPVYGLSAALVVTGLVLYSLTLLVRNILAGLRAVPEETRQAARGMGYGPRRLLLRRGTPARAARRHGRTADRHRLRPSPSSRSARSSDTAASATSSTPG
ncbi:hypothetical protein SCYAM73S_03769 [Streptomyces cyaneofuscatus]